jgi:hypothetical protein
MTGPDISGLQGELFGRNISKWRRESGQVTTCIKYMMTSSTVEGWATMFAGYKDELQCSMTR